VGLSAELDQQNGGRASVASVARALVLECGSPVLARVELEWAPRALDRPRLPSWSDRSVDERLDVLGRSLIGPFVVMVVGQREFLRAARS
jgi:hypothetical protein